MEHVPNPSEYAVTGSVDFVVPLKQVGIITRSVLEAIHIFYRPRRIIVITRRSEIKMLEHLLPFWQVGRVECVEEETFFVRNFGLSLDDIVAEYDAQRSGDSREPGWWVQQLIKLGAATQIPNISPVYIVWDGDLVPTRRWRLGEIDQNGEARFSIAILQAESRSVFNTTEYANCMQHLIGFSPVDPEDGGTFVAHHMVFHCEYVKEMLDLMIARTGSNLPWPRLIMACSRQFYRFSEYKTYATYMLNKHPEHFHYHKLDHFGAGGLRFREANTVIDDMLTVCRVTDGGISYSHVRDFVSANWKTLCPSSDDAFPAYVQLDHVYGLEGRELNLSTPWAPVPLPSPSSSSSASSGGNGYFATSSMIVSPDMKDRQQQLLAGEMMVNSTTLSYSPTSIAAFPDSPPRIIHACDGQDVSHENENNPLRKEPIGTQKNVIMPPSSPFGMLTASFRAMLIQYTR